jgi:hypothetical protein
LRPQGSGAGSASVEATVTHRTLINQRARGETTVRFQATESSAFESTATEPL